MEISYHDALAWLKQESDIEVIAQWNTYADFLEADDMPCIYVSFESLVDRLVTNMDALPLKGFITGKASRNDKYFYIDNETTNVIGLNSVHDKNSPVDFSKLAMLVVEYGNTEYTQFQIWFEKRCKSYHGVLDD